MRELEKILKALANRRRLAILKYLKTEHQASVGEIAREIEISFKSTSKHLAVLLGADIVEREQNHFEALYRIAPNQKPPSKKIIDLL